MAFAFGSSEVLFGYFLWFLLCLVFYALSPMVSVLFLGASIALSVPFCSQQQNALGYNLSMRGMGTVGIYGPRFEEFLRSRKDFLRSRKGGLARGSCKDFAAGLHSLG